MSIASSAPVRALRLVWLAGALGVLGTAAPPLSAQQPSAAQTSAIRQACSGDFRAQCAGVPSGGSAALACLQNHAAALSPPCQQALRALSGDAAAAAAPAQAAPPAANVADIWPHTIDGQGGSAVVYQPQVIAWPERQTLNTRIAMAITPAGATSAVLGTVEASFATRTDLAARQVTLSDARLTSSRFRRPTPRRPSASSGRSAPRWRPCRPSACRWTWCC